jgi:hypothetical protein
MDVALLLLRHHRPTPRPAPPPPHRGSLYSSFFRIDVISREYIRDPVCMRVLKLAADKSECANRYVMSQKAYEHPPPAF